MRAQDWSEILPPLLAQAGIDTGVAQIVPLTGGVSSDIVEIVLDDGRSVCAKRALARLKVASVWEAPLARNHFEVEWLRRAGALVPGIAPAVLAEDAANGVALLEFLPSADYALWKLELLAGRFHAGVAPRVAAALAQVHRGTWQDAGAAALFATDSMFDALRLDPYLRTLAQRTPDLSAQILAVLNETATTKLALVHGDVSPKNILVSRRDGHPVLLDAECAWFGDPAFDAAFCLNHLVLKSVHLPNLRDELRAAAQGFFDTWVAGLPDGAGVDAERRVARLLPCLMLARIDGKSPVEYLSEENRTAVRALARPMIAEPPAGFAELTTRLEKGLSP